MASQLVYKINSQPSQIEVAKGGVTLYNIGPGQITVSTKTSFLPSRTASISQYAAMPWASAPLWAVSTSEPSLLVIPGQHNILSPQVTLSGETVNVTGTIHLAPTTKVTIDNAVDIGTVQSDVTVNVQELPPPVVATVGILSVKVALLGTATAVPIVPATRTQTYFSHCRIGFVIWGTPTNTGKHIYLGDSAGGVSTAQASIPAGATKLVGSFSVAYGNAVTMRVSGKAGDHANVWAA